jgi:putative protease
VIKPDATNERHSPELLAPAGDLACLQAAVDAGADAVYLGMEGLNMRAAATGLTLDSLPECADRCRAAGVHLYVAVNTIVFDEELPLVDSLVGAAAEHADAVICWDPAVIEACVRLGAPFHVSTQASVANPAAAAFYRRLGAQRVVPARECTLEEILRIRNEAGIEVEVFAHGAMCVSVSGRCFLSELVHGKSGNRGECYQNCRREYRVLSDDGRTDLKIGSNYIMSARDLCTLPFLERLLDAGVDSLKIEGRNRPAEYVHTVVSAYRKAIDAWEHQRLTDDLKETLIQQCRTVFNRGFSSGFFLGRPITDFTDTDGSRAAWQKAHVGRVTNHYRKAGIAEINVLDTSFGIGDTLLITGPTTGVVNLTVQDLRQDEHPAKCAARGAVTIPCTEKVRAGDRVYRLTPRPPVAESPCS